MPQTLDPFAIPDLSGPAWEAAKVVHYQDLRPKATERSNFSGDYDYELLRDIAGVSKEEHVDPYTMMAIGLQESRLGDVFDKDAGFATRPQAKAGWVFNMQSAGYPKEERDKAYRRFSEESASLDYQTAHRRLNIRLATKMLKYKRKYANRLYKKFKHREPIEAEILQAWQGYGKIRLKKSFGGKKNLSGFNDFPNGKRLIEHIKSLKANPSIRQIVEGGN